MADIRRQTEPAILQNFAVFGHPLKAVKWSRGLPEAWQQKGATQLDFDVPVETATGANGIAKLSFGDDSASLRCFIEGQELPAHQPLSEQMAEDDPARKMMEDWEREFAAVPPEQQLAPADSNPRQLRHLADLRDRGVLTDDEFQAEKKRVLDQPDA